MSCISKTHWLLIINIKFLINRGLISTFGDTQQTYRSWNSLLRECANRKTQRISLWSRDTCLFIKKSTAKEKFEFTSCQTREPVSLEILERRARATPKEASIFLRGGFTVKPPASRTFVDLSYELDNKWSRCSGCVLRGPRTFTILSSNKRETNSLRTIVLYNSRQQSVCEWARSRKWNLFPIFILNTRKGIYIFYNG